jgi:hypothetical protein
MSKAKKFMLQRDRTIASTCGISIEFKKGEWHLTPPAMFAEVIAAGGVCEDEDVDPAPVGGAPTDPAARQAAVFDAFRTLVLANNRDDFTAGNAPHNAAVSRVLGWSLSPKERDILWVKFAQETDGGGDGAETPAPAPAEAPAPAAKKAAAAPAKRKYTKRA